MRIEHHLSSNEPSPLAAHFYAWAPMPRGCGYRGRGSPFSGRDSPSSNHGHGLYFSQDPASPSRPICQLCRKIGHTAPRCYKRPDPALVAAPNSQAFYSSTPLPSKENWYPDTRATHHITNDVQNLNLSSEDYTG
jgi:hypothetical protein